MINVTCAKCGHEMKFKDVGAGRVVKCPECDAKFRLQSAEDDDGDSSPVEPRRRGPSNDPDARLEKRLRLDERDRSANRESPHAPEWILPTVLLGIALLLPIAGAGIQSGATGIGEVLMIVALKLAFTVPLSIGAMFVIAPLLGISFGALGLAILRIAAITVSTLGISTIFERGDLELAGYLVSVPIGYFLFSYFFDLTLFETIVSLFIIGLIQRIVAMYIVLAILRGTGVGPPTSSLDHRDPYAAPTILLVRAAPN